LLRWDGNEEPRGGSFPEPNCAAELDVHWHSISNAQRLALAAWWDEVTPLCRNQLQATQTACLHLAAGTGENAATPTTYPGVRCRGSGAHCVRRTHRTPTERIDNKYQTHIDKILPTTVVDFDI